MRSLPPTLRPSLAARLVVARLAMLAVLAATLLPGISRLLQPAEFWGALCQSPLTARATSDSPRFPLPAGHEHDDACALCTLAHTTPTLAGATPAAVAVIAYAPPAPPAPAPVRTRVAQSRAPSARAPPFESSPFPAA